MNAKIQLGLIALGTLFLILLVVIMIVAGGTWRVKTHGEIQASVEKIYQRMKSFKEIQTWSSWKKYVIENSVKFSGPNMGAQSTASFKQKYRKGLYSITVTNLIPNRSISYRVKVNKKSITTGICKWNIISNAKSRMNCNFEGQSQGFFAKIISFFIRGDFEHFLFEQILLLDKSFAKK